MRQPLPRSVLFCCDRNQIRSPFAEAVLRRRFGGRIRTGSAGVERGAGVDPFMAEVAREIGIDLSGHRPASLDDLAGRGDALAGWELVVTLSPAAQRRVLDDRGPDGSAILHWRVLDPAGLGERRALALDAYRETRDRIVRLVLDTFG